MKHAFLTIALAALAFTAKAQPEAGRFSIMPRVGVSIANLPGDQIYTLSSSSDRALSSAYKAGLQAGVDFEYQALPALAVSLGAYYSDQGCRYKDSDVDTSLKPGKYTAFTRMSTNLKYVNIPLMFSFYAADNFAIKAGFQVGVNVDANFKYTTNDYTRKDDSSVEYKQPTDSKTDLNAKKIYMAIPVGISYEYMNVILDARYNIGLGNAFEKNTAFDSHNSVFTISAGYRFTL